MHGDGQVLPNIELQRVGRRESGNGRVSRQYRELQIVRCTAPTQENVVGINSISKFNESCIAGHGGWEGPQFDCQTACEIGKSARQLHVLA